MQPTLARCTITCFTDTSPACLPAPAPAPAPQLKASLVVMGLANSGKSSIVRRMAPDADQQQVSYAARHMQG